MITNELNWPEIEIGPGYYGPMCPYCGALVVREFLIDHKNWHEAHFGPLVPFKTPDEHQIPLVVEVTDI